MSLEYSGLNEILLLYHESGPRIKIPDGLIITQTFTEVSSWDIWENSYGAKCEKEKVHLS